MEFEYYQPIDLKLYRPAFNFPKFYAISHFVLYIQKYSNAVNYNTIYSKAVHKYFLKAFYNRTNKKEYKSQIKQYIVRHTNIIAIKDMIAVAKRGELNKKLLKMEDADKTGIAKFAQVSNAIDLGSKHSWAMSNNNIDIAGDLRPISIIKY